MKKKIRILTIFLLFIIYVYTNYITLLPDVIYSMNNEEYKIRNLPGIEKIITTETSTDNSKITNIEIKLFGKIDLKDISIVNIEDAEVVPIGKVIGLKLYTNGVLIVGFTELENKNNVLTKSYDGVDIEAGDTIIKINDEIVETIDELKNHVLNSNGEDMNLTILREGRILNTNIKPVEVDENEYRLGLWVKDAATGVGTMSFYMPSTKAFGILGHGITDSDTNDLINIESGEIVTSKIISLQKGTEGVPGEIRGTIINQQTIGKVIKNTQFGVFGILDNLIPLNIDRNETIPVASRNEIKEGKATVICSYLNSLDAKEYEIEIEKIYYDNNYNNKSMLIKITDEKLIEETGGIIRGLSGAPIIQNGKFCGAITHVLVQKPDTGYAVFADLMIKQIVNLEND